MTWRRLRQAAACWLIAVGAVAATGCGRAPHPAVAWHDAHPLPADTLTFATAEIGTYGGRFVIAATNAPKTFNALMAGEQSSNDVNNLMYAGLAEFDNATQTLYPLLAKSWDVSADGLTYTWHLRHGARFSDGHPITSSDVMFMFELVYDDALSPSLRDLLTVDGQRFQVSAPDSYTVVTRLPGPHSLAVASIGSLRILPRHVLEPVYRRGLFASAYPVTTPPESLVTSGAFRLRRYVPGEKVVLERNPWWLGVDRDGQRLPYLDELVFLIVPDQNTAALKFQAGDVDALDNVKPEDYKTYIDGMDAGGYTLHDLGPSLNTSFLWFNLNRVRTAKVGRHIGDPIVALDKLHWFSNRGFRRAVSSAIDRDAIIRGPYFGEALKNWSAPSVGSRRWGELGITGVDYDPARANRILDSLGWLDRNRDGLREDDRGRTITFTLKTNSDNAVRVAIATLVRDDLQRVGIRCVPVPVDFNTLTTNLREDFQYEAILAGLGSAVPPEPGMYANFVTSGGLRHYWNVRQPKPETRAELELDQLYAQVRSASDDGARLAPWKHIVKIMNDECFVVWLPVQMLKIPIRNRFGNLQPTAVPHRVLWNIDRVFAKKRPARP
jgi:peptide/nickel transport system substrate-binding protein